MSRSPLSLLALGAALVLVLVGCDDGDDATGADGASVDAVNVSFEPAEITVSAGTSITFTNQDQVAHTVTAGTPDDPGDAFDERISSQGDAATITFDDPGEVVYFCRVHPNMRGTVIVEG